MPERHFPTITPIDVKKYSLQLDKEKFTVTSPSMGAKRIGTMDELFARLRPPMPIGCLPVALRWVSPDFRHVIIERPPRQAPIDYLTTSWDMAGRNAERRLYHCWIPWTETLISFSPAMDEVYQLRVMCRPSPLTSLDDPLFHIGIPNVMAMGSICCAPEFPREYNVLRTKKDVTWSKLVSWVANHPWVSGFNFGANTQPDFTPDKMARTAWPNFLEKWEKKSLEQVLAWRWPQAYKTAQLWCDGTLKQAKYSNDAAALYAAALKQR